MDLTVRPRMQEAHWLTASVARLILLPDSNNYQNVLRVDFLYPESCD